MNSKRLILFVAILCVILCLCVYLWIQFVAWRRSDKKISSCISQFEDISAQACKDTSSLNLSDEHKIRNDLFEKILKMLLFTKEDKVGKYFELTKTDIFKKYVSSKNLFFHKLKCSDFINIFLPESKNNESDIKKIISKAQYGLKNRCFSKIFKQYLQSLEKNDFETEKYILHKIKSRLLNVSDSQDLINILAATTEIFEHSFLGLEDYTLIQNTASTFRFIDIQDQFLYFANIILLFEVLYDVFLISGLKELINFYLFKTKKDVAFTKNSIKKLQSLLLHVNCAVVSNFMMVIFSCISKDKLSPLDQQIVMNARTISLKHVSFYMTMLKNPGSRISKKRIGYAISRFWMMLILLWMLTTESRENTNIEIWKFIKKVFNKKEKKYVLQHPIKAHDEDFIILVNEIIDLLIKIFKLISLILKLEIDIKNENVIEINDLIIEICDKIDNHELFGVIFRDIFDFC